jgi:hypothetical protein
MQAYADIVRTDREYRRGFVAMSANQLGDALVTGGVLLLLMTLAAFNPALAAVGLAVFTLVEIGIAAASFLEASHRRDNAEALERSAEPSDAGSEEERKGHAARLVRSGYIDAAAAGLLALGVVGTSFLGFGAVGVFLVVICIKAVQSYNKSYETGSWNCLKYSLGSTQTRQRQLNMRATIGAIEMGVGGLIYGVGSLVTFMALWGVGIAFPPALPFVALGTVLLGGTLASAAKIRFGRWAATGSGGGASIVVSPRAFSVHPSALSPQKSQLVACSMPAPRGPAGET